MLTAKGEAVGMEEQTIELIAQRVIAALRQDLEAIAAQLSEPAKGSEQLSVGQLARRLGVARSTVYAHWREWGGYKLGNSEKAPIRFDGSALPIATAPPAKQATTDNARRKRRERKRRQRRLLVDAPRIRQTIDGIG